MGRIVAPAPSASPWGARLVSEFFVLAWLSVTRGIKVVFKVVQGTERDGQNDCREKQRSQDPDRLLPVRSSQEKQDRQGRGNDGELKDVRSRALVRLRWLKVAADYRHQRDEGQHEKDPAAHLIDLLVAHGILRFPGYTDQILHLLQVLL